MKTCKDCVHIDVCFAKQLGTGECAEICRDYKNKADYEKALKKQIPTKVTHEASLYKCCTCPNCKNVVDKFEEFGDSTVRVTYRYCHFCGQKLDWSDT